ncbi:diguanylate cyclase [Paenibacillus mucilaginosus]|uniref:GGDEF:Response regulator receiver n=3 Tax=Paenibacillus mucilaginosus TaxID=61624 RepID=H6NKZ8_9BACL|nr:diguanylate cyclase [Paenibacillus mucilaginosus]AEI40691.1 GGDEF:Response regulator receiver [Paenibacillus mucilaginosus KNP414]AFC29304.1 GGDEF:Response regulator receiver [Paenibacillus mucilaginosus 3016]AFH61482.1 diguanylate cyclase [Paenibacillus mucilaginosus K02]MCG7211823.1 diguanylate cyclase [Paenibacillus mucilaginosus]WDM29828.1 diguanylate cyclase [Paenibacillus mucilaginosus]
MVFTLRKKLYVSFLAIIVLFVITVILSTVLTQRIVHLTNETLATEKRLEVLQRLNLFARTANDNGAHYLLAPLYVEEDFKSQFDASVQYVEEEMSLLESMTADPDGKAQIARFKERWTAFARSKQKIMALKKQGEVRGAQESYTKDSFDPVAFSLHSFFKAEQSRIEQYNSDIQRSGRTIQWVNYTMGSSAIVLSILIAFLLSNYLIRRIRLLRRSAQTVAEGNLQVADLHFKGQDELQELAEAFNRMTHSLRTVIHSNQFLQHLSTRDGLTGIANRRCYDETMEREWKRLSEFSRPISLILFDIDYFKRYNDRYGHQAGDECLREVAGILQRSVGPGDLAARYGGEEFVVLLPDQEEEEAVRTAERFRQALARRGIPHELSEVSGSVTVSIGIASATASDTGNPGSLLQEADQALYEAKRSGRNGICSHRGMHSRSEGEVPL